MANKSLANGHCNPPFAAFELRNLKLVFGLEPKGCGDIELYRVELPGQVVEKQELRARLKKAR